VPDHSLEKLIRCEPKQLEIGSDYDDVICSMSVEQFRASLDRCQRDRCLIGPQQAYRMWVKRERNRRPTEFSC
jgi:hypothetical protein